MFVAPAQGTTQLVQAIAAQLPAGSLRLGTPVRRLQPAADGWQLEIGAGGSEPLRARAVIMATPAHATAALLEPLGGPLAEKLRRIPHAPCAIVSLGYRRDQIGHPLNGFGYVTPLVERRQVLSASFSSVKYTGRAPSGCELFRVFIGGACQAELLDLSDDRLREIAQKDLAELLSIQGEPIFHYLARWGPTMPQYHVGHHQLVAEIDAEVQRFPGLQLAGNAYRGVGVPHCIHDGQQAAQRVVAALNAGPFRGGTPGFSSAGS